jgi:hypothetical protein
MMGDSAEVALEITCASRPELEPVTILAPRGSGVHFVVRAAQREFGLEEANHLVRDEEFSRWKGQLSSGSWTLRENRDIEEGKWWTEAEVDSFTDRKLPGRSRTSADVQRSYHPQTPYRLARHST